MNTNKISYLIESLFVNDRHREALNSWFERAGSSQAISMIPELYSLLQLYEFDMINDSGNDEYPFIHPESDIKYRFRNIASQSPSLLEREIRENLCRVKGYRMPPPKNGPNSYALEKIFYIPQHSRVVCKLLKEHSQKQAENIAGSFFQLLEHYEFDLNRGIMSSFSFIHKDFTNISFKFPNIGTQTCVELERNMRSILFKAAGAKKIPFQLPVPLYFSLQAESSSNNRYSMKFTKRSILKEFENEGIKPQAIGKFSISNAKCEKTAFSEHFYSFPKQNGRVWVSSNAVLPMNVAPVIEHLVGIEETVALFCMSSSTFQGKSIEPNSICTRNQRYDTWIELRDIANSPLISMFDISTLSESQIKQIFMHGKFKNIVLAWSHSECFECLQEYFNQM